MPGPLSYRHSEENRQVAINYVRATLDRVSATISCEERAYQETLEILARE